MSQTSLPVLIAVGVIALLATLLVLSLLRRRTNAAGTTPTGPQAFHQTMTPGREYEVVRAFTDYDGGQRQAGERWVFRGYNFLPYEDGLTLITEPGPGVRLQWRRETQADIIDNLGDYIRPV